MRSGGIKIYIIRKCVLVSISKHDFFTLGELLLVVCGELLTLTMMHEFFYGVRVTRAAYLPVVVEAVVRIPLIAVIQMLIPIFGDVLLNNRKAHHSKDESTNDRDAHIF